MQILMRGFLLFLMFLGTVLSARPLSYSTVHAMPKSVEKDYFLWRYLSDKRCTKAEAQKLIREAKRVNGKLAKAYKKKTGRTATKHRKKPAALSAKAKAAVQKKKAITLNVLKQSDPWAAWRKLTPDMQVYAFNHAGTSGRKQLDHPISASLYATLTAQYGFNDSVQRIRRENLPQWSKALLYPPTKKHRLTHRTLLHLGFNALHRGKATAGEAYFRLAAKKSRKREEVDQALFWAYQSRHDKRFLHELTRSYDINLYTLLARDILHLNYPKTITPDLPKAHLLSRSALSDPIHWAKLKRKIFGKKTDLKRLATHYRSEESAGYYSYILSKASRDTAQYFPMPYRDLLAKLPKSRQAILYAIARQESRFVPASISTSYALGMMQIMPFLVRHLAKQRKEKVNYDAMFDPRHALTYANDHMNYLTKWLMHPLFIAYAYNAGIGYTRRLIRKKHLFNGKGAYEPYLSLELVDNGQARHYGKHVLTNYVIYMNKLGSPLRLTEMLRFLHQPDRTDHFRKRKK
jgi:soluble lytic murein transglycosylase